MAVQKVIERFNNLCIVLYIPPVKTSKAKKLPQLLNVFGCWPLSDSTGLFWISEDAIFTDHMAKVYYRGH
ncbi:hypothetical protein DPMN_100871 [Dreissena polymorpha]|uniref:Uncharacterized protein n=1 Tax=Dreissena polymorpha TaxID=45954 RepID=A0A9D4LK16_DREPO|nr:hypothetical protein DPMN_100871 [Dreissena polymorpha]